MKLIFGVHQIQTGKFIKLIEKLKPFILAKSNISISPLSLRMHKFYPHLSYITF